MRPFSSSILVRYSHKEPKSFILTKREPSELLTIPSSFGYWVSKTNSWKFLYILAKLPIILNYNFATMRVSWESFPSKTFVGTNWVVLILARKLLHSLGAWTWTQNKSTYQISSKIWKKIIVALLTRKMQVWLSMKWKVSILFLWWCVIDVTLSNFLVSFPQSRSLNRVSRTVRGDRSP